MSQETVLKRLPYIAVTVTLVLAGWAFLKRPAGVPAASSALGLVDPALAAPWPEAIWLSPIVRDRLARDVIDGRRSLIAAASLFGELNRLQGRPTVPPWEDPVFAALRLSGNSPNARLCQQVEIWVRVALRDDPTRREAVLARLDREFRAAPREHGDIRLPDAARLEPVEQLLAEVRDTLPERERRHY
jgi:hypothetical protein